MSRQFWAWAPTVYELCCSQLTIDEVAKGDESAAQRRLGYAKQCRLLPDNLLAENLAQDLVRIKAVPATEPEDAAHIAIATVAQMKCLASWNFSHMVGPQAKRQLERAIVSLGYEPCLLTTPEEIFEEEAL